MDRRVLLFSIACVVITWFSIYDSNHAAYCQSAVYDMGIAAGHSIIRNYRPGIDIVFLNDKTDSGFCYVERSTNTKRFFNIPAPINVIDFTIYGRYVFFCGTMNSKAIVGSFDISSVFFSGGYFNYCLLPNNNNGYQNTPDSIMSLYCIKTYTVDDELHLVMLGKGNSSTSNSKVQSMDCVVDAWSNNLSNWVFHYLMDTADAFRYTDIAVTDNYVIIASYHNDPSINSWAYTYWPYSRPSTTGNSIFISHLFSGNTINAPYFMTDYIRFFCNNDEKVLATPMGGNRFATACGAKVPYFQSQSNQATVVCI